MFAALTVTVKVQFARLFAGSVAVQVTVVVPTRKVDPEAGEQLTVAEQLSITVGSAYDTTTPVPGFCSVRIIFAGQVMVGGCVSLTVTVNEQLGPDVVVQVTVVVPTAKVEPEVGEQVTVPQAPVVAGAA